MTEPFAMIRTMGDAAARKVFPRYDERNPPTIEITNNVVYGKAWACDHIVISPRAVRITQTFLMPLEAKEAPAVLAFTGFGTYPSWFRRQMIRLARWLVGKAIA